MNSLKSVWQIYGGRLRLTVFGGSHDEFIGGCLEGLPAGLPFSRESIRTLCARRAPGGKFSTKRKEADEPVILSGASETGGAPDGQSRPAVTTGEPLEIRIYNTSARSSDYGEMVVPRPSHADYPAYVKYDGRVDLRGGGHFSGRLTAVTTFFGGVCLGILRERGIRVGAHLLQVGDAKDIPFDPLTVSEKELRIPSEREFPSLGGGEAMQRAISDAAEQGDSVGAVIECAAIGLPIGLGTHMFQGVEGVLSSLLFAIPAVKGVEFGDGFAFAGERGSRANDGYRMGEKGVTLLSNHCGGILGGMTSGAPLLLRCALKPTPSIFLPQPSVNLREGTDEILTIHGRHDPCVAVRAVPAVEAATAIGLTELLLEEIDDGK